MPFAPAFCQMQKKKKERIMFFSPSLLSWNRKKERIPSLLSEKKKEKAVRFPSPLLENRQKEKERRTSPFLLHSFPTADGMADLPLPWKKGKKEKDEKTEERRQKEEGQKRKGTERRKKEKEARERRTEKRQRNTLQKGAFLTQESRKRTERGFPVRKQETGLRTPFFAS